ncbi:MAG: 4Fe-4S dicluster domain-containing protein, partial [Chloroflexi bacterium]|nr:4Fe-4S dicluster domain-containing protein [Chloroflexota bacterium]
MSEGLPGGAMERGGKAAREVEAPSLDDIARCVHCGLCLESCPTYLVTGVELHSPRGRLHLIGALQEGRIELSETYRSSIDLCLLCRACEAVCPSGVPFGSIMEMARAQAVKRSTDCRSTRLLRRLVFDVLLPNPRALRSVAALLRTYQRTPLAWLARRSGLLARLSPPLASAEAQLPRLSERFFEPEMVVFPAIGERRLRVGFFSGCVMPYLYAGVHEATLRVLRRNGCEVVVPRDQRCCGALHLHSGERERARELARANAHAFLGAGVDAVVVNAAGCGSTLKEYGELGGDDPELGRRFSALVKDVNELLAG